ncbi:MULTISPECIES: ABC transporter permease [Prauserella salsuginis group]|uniref:Transport permease protein n=2 Tax=Prauserella salsuginis group TaxID=2893672 RepID=A0A839XUK6_9PSEU|nr:MULTISPECIES: ABC transporter permease [Prauserella salsuginis group]MBB3665719.1 ABC-2 type transport system permease protein [Prauserella sediminis]MCR3722912.1 ABC-2 type transport system permease protein [Prauserella flava]MCR3737413.1 ABC-2 type transport system permease protein [Prauserella salsuginis]
MTSTSNAERADAGGDTPVADNLGAVLATGEPPTPPSAWSASVTFAWRAMLKIKHVPEQLFDVTAFPVIMTLMFTYLFGGALAGSPEEYLQYLLPGVLVMSVAMITMYTGVGLNADIQKGVFDRFRTLPIWRPSALVGAVIGDVCRYSLASVVIILLGLALGYRPGGGVLGVLAGVGLLLVFSFAFSWIWTLLGLLLRSERSVMGVSAMVLFPLSFLSNVFVDPRTMPSWLQGFVDVNPIAHLVAAVRGALSGEWDASATLWMFVSAGIILAIFGPLTMRMYNRK